MAFPTQDGKQKNSKFRQSRYDRENTPTEPGPKARAHDLEGTKKPSPSADSQEPGPEQSRARELHMSFNDVEGTHHVHAIDEAGAEEHTDHPTREAAFQHGMKRGGIHMPDKEAFDERARTPSEAENEPDADDYAVQSL